MARPTCPTRLRTAYFVAGIACAAYFVILGLSSRFGLSASGLWLAASAALLAAGALCGRTLPKWLRYTWRGLWILGLTALLGLGCLVASGMFSQAPAGMDALVVLGARVDPDGPSPALRHRVEAVAAILPNHPDAVIIASGGQGADEPMSEARCIRDELVKRGVPVERILMEEKSTATAENLAFSRELLPKDDARVGIVTNNYHVWRALRLARRVGYEHAYGVAGEYTGWTLLHFMLREALCIPVEWLRGNL